MDTFEFVLNKKIKGVASGFDHATRTGDNTFSIFFIDGTKVDLTIPLPQNGAKGDKGDKGVSVTNAYTQDEHLFIVLDNGQTIDCGEVGSNVPQNLIDQITENKAHIGTLSTLKVGTFADLVSAINAVYDLGASKFEFVDKFLNITTRGGVVIPIDCSAIITDTNIEELKNVVTENVVDGQSLVFDVASGKWTNKSISSESALEEAKEYTDEQISKLTHADAIACDEKPIVGTDEITYKKDGVTLTTDNFDTWFYYKNDEGKAVQTIWIDGVEFTLEMAGEVDLTQYVEKNDVTSVFEENPADLSKIPNLAYMKALRDVIILAIGKKVNTTDIVDDLLSDSVDKPLSAKQGKQLNAKIEILIDDDNASKTSTYSSKKIDEAIDGVNPSWSGTQAEFDALDKETLKDGQIINITDDFDDKLINDNVVATNSVWSSSKVNANLGELDIKVDGKQNFTKLDENTKTIQELFDAQGNITCGYQSRFADGVGTDFAYITIQKTNVNYGNITFHSNHGIYQNRINNGVWSGWKELATIDKVAQCVENKTPNAKTVSFELNSTSWNCGTIYGNTNGGGNFKYDYYVSSGNTVELVKLSPSGQQGSITASLSGTTLTLTASGTTAIKTVTIIKC